MSEVMPCVQVEIDVAGLTDLSNSAIKVQLDKETVTKIGRDLKRFDSFDAGLFLSSVAIFDTLDDPAAKKSHFSLADALSFFTKFNKLVYMLTAGETWFSIEAEEQLAYTQDHDGVSMLSPWMVFLATTPQELFDDDLIAPASKNVVMGISELDQDTSLRVAANNKSAGIFDGFVVDVNTSEHRDEDSALTPTTISDHCCPWATSLRSCPRARASIAKTRSWRRSWAARNTPPVVVYGFESTLTLIGRDALTFYVLRASPKQQLCDDR